MNAIRRLLVVLAVLAAILALGHPGVAQPRGKGNGGGGGGGGGGGSTPPPNAAIVYSDTNGLYVMNSDGSNKVRVLSVRRQDSARNPVWSPDGAGIAFWGRFGGVSGLYTMNAGGGGVQRIHVLQYQASLSAVPDWSAAPAPDGNYKISFTDSPGGAAYRDIFIINPDGTGLQRLTDGAVTGRWHSYAAFMRSGAAIISDDGLDGTALYSLGLDGAGAVGITGMTTVASTRPVFQRCANDHDWIVMTTSIPPSLSLRMQVLDVADPFSPRVLIQFASSTDDRWGSFSPDDTMIAFHRGGSGGGIFRMNADGTGAVLLSSKGFDPNWKR